LVFSPTLVPFTLTLTTQGVPTLIVPPVKLSDVAFANGLKVGVPQPEAEAVGVSATARPAGNVSLKATLVSCWLRLPLVSVSVSVDVVLSVPLSAMLVGLKAFTTVGAWITGVARLLLKIAEKFPPETAAWLLIEFPRKLLLMMTLNVIVVLAPAGSENPLPVPFIVTVSPASMAVGTMVYSPRLLMSIVRGAGPGLLRAAPETMELFPEAKTLGDINDSSFSAIR
jgi:hypothetical protein